MPKTTLPGATTDVLVETISAYTYEAYTNAKKLSSTAIVGGNSMIDKNTETFTGQLRWFKPLNPVINTASITDSTAGTKSSYSTDYLSYIKTVRTHGYEKVNMKQIVTQHDGLARMGRDFAETHAQDEHNTILEVLKGVAITELLNGAGVAAGGAGLGGQNFDNDPTDAKYGFYVDLGAAKNVVDATATIQGAARAEGFLRAFGMAFKDYEPAYAYLIASPETLASIRSANLVDQTKVVDGQVEFETIFNGKFRLITTRAAQSLSAAEKTKINLGSGVDLVGTKTSFIVLPGAIAMEQLEVPDAMEITRDGNAYKGGGVTSVWHRWGYVAHPAGYSWNGLDTDFVPVGGFSSVMEGGATKLLTAVASTDATTGVFKRKAASALSLGILPVFHS
jgi:hypothetical protein